MDNRAMDLRAPKFGDNPVARTVTKVTQEHLPFYVKMFLRAPQEKAQPKVLLTVILSFLFIVSSAVPASADSPISDIGFTSGGLDVSTLSTGASAWDVVESGYSLNDLDPVTGSMSGDEFGQGLSADYATQADLMANDMLAYDTAALADQARREAAARKAAEDAKKAKTQSAGGNYDTSSCPTSAPAGTLRAGAERDGILKICQDSVAQARSPEAARAIIYALNHLGSPYSNAKRNEEGYYDCSSYTTRSYQAAGVNIAPPGQNAPTTATMRGARWAVPISYSQLKPGDLIQPFSGHVAMWLADGWMVHTNRPGDVSHIKKAYTSAYWAAYVDPSKA